MTRQTNIGRTNHITSKALFNFASEQAQTNASLAFIEVVALYSSSIYQHLLLEKMREAITVRGIKGEAAVRAAIICFDYCLSDEMRVIRGNIPLLTDEAAIYYRSEQYKQILPHSVNDVITTQFGCEPSDIILSHPNRIFGILQNTDTVGLLTPEVAFWIARHLTLIEKPKPPWGIPRQELYRSLLKCGINPLDNIRFKEISSFPRQQSESPSRRTYRRKGLVALNATSKDIESWETRTIDHWSRLLDTDNRGGIATLFTSGTSSNEIAMQAIAKLTNSSVFIHPYWYFENQQTANSLFNHQTATSREAEILLLNIDPTNYFRLDMIDISLEPYLSDFVSGAVDRPEQTRYMVVDVTANPIFSLEKHVKQQLPHNLVIIKTLSVSKHQCGGRNYFFGVAHTTHPTLPLIMGQIKQKMGEDLYEAHKIHFPRPTRQHLLEKTSKVSALNARIGKSQIDNRGWYIVPHIYHSTISPPQELLNNLVRFGHLLNSIEFEQAVAKTSALIEELVIEAVLTSDYSNIEFGDSFGLPETRLSVQGKVSTLEGLAFRLKLPRICPGYDTDFETLNSFCKFLLSKLDNNLDVLNSFYT